MVHNAFPAEKAETAVSGKTEIPRPALMLAKIGPQRRKFHLIDRCQSEVGEHPLEETAIGTSDGKDEERLFQQLR